MERNYSQYVFGIGIALVIFVLIIGGACLFIYFIRPAQQPTQSGPETFYTQAAQTVSAQFTLTAAAGSPVGPTAVPPSTTSLPTDMPTNTLTAPPPPTFTPVPPTATPLPPTPTPIPCNWAKFIEDVTVKDGTVFPPNAELLKTWRLENIGSCTWSRDYRLVFFDGERMDGPRVSQLEENVDPGETVDVSVELIAPEKGGRYRGYWMLSNSSGEEFGIGANADDAFWVEIRVIESDEFAYDFALNYCLARWSSDAGRLNCPGDVGDSDGFVILVDRPEIEIGRVENEPALWTNPEDEDDGWIIGEYPEFKVEEGDRFKAVVGCQDGAQDCDVIFQVSYRIGDGPVQIFWDSREVYDDSFTKVDLDLRPLAGQRVKFILGVLANGSPNDDEAFWLSPRITD
ncbi:MAG TPA: NBR1-Ig-like domain-containing protein [Anaerolineales bacterium]|nr:NBR1-Ig-like domain-containing protein [Anaerolineales bacterium]